MQAYSLIADMALSPSMPKVASPWSIGLDDKYCRIAAEYETSAGKSVRIPSVAVYHKNGNSAEPIELFADIAQRFREHSPDIPNMLKDEDSLARAISHALIEGIFKQRFYEDLGKERYWSGDVASAFEGKRGLILTCDGFERKLSSYNTEHVSDMMHSPGIPFKVDPDKVCNRIENDNISILGLDACVMDCGELENVTSSLPKGVDVAYFGHSRLPLDLAKEFCTYYGTRIGDRKIMFDLSH
mgnify:CR=1 FL=1